MAKLTRHARQRSRQRDISQTAIDLLLEYGDVERARDGLDRVVFNAPAKRRVRNEIGRDGVRLIKRYLSAYAIVSRTEHVITVGNRPRRNRRR